ncbi:recombinase family protein [Nitrosovibrio sp. Nv4]|uniref:recombinase family protein n=1 Tax=Nitrosovibrio sp. Nv4 TaxID=1945880 RepID=UPI0035135BDF
MMQIVGAFAEFERAMLRERTRNGLDASRQEGRVGGRRPKLKTHQQQEIMHLVNSGQKTAADAARLFNVHPATVSHASPARCQGALTGFCVPLRPKPLKQGLEEVYLFICNVEHSRAAII